MLRQQRRETLRGDGLSRGARDEGRPGVAAAVAAVTAGKLATAPERSLGSLQVGLQLFVESLLGHTGSPSRPKSGCWSCGGGQKERRAGRVAISEVRLAPLVNYALSVPLKTSLEEARAALALSISPGLPFDVGFDDPSATSWRKRASDAGPTSLAGGSSSRCSCCFCRRYSTPQNR